MLAKKCPKCSAVWYTALPKCAFCGIEGVEVPTSTHTGRLPEKPAPAVQLEPAKVESSTAVAEATPVPPTSADVPVPVPVPVDPTPVPVAPDPVPVLETKAAEPEKPAIALTPLPPGFKKPDPATLPPAPRVPSSKVPVTFALLGLAAAALLPAAMYASMNRILTLLAYLVGGILIPYGPLAWWTGRRYEERCIDLGYKPASSGRLGRLLGTSVTMLLAIEGMVAALQAALARFPAGK